MGVVTFQAFTELGPIQVIKYEGLVGDCLGHCSHCQTMGLYYRSALPICCPSSLCCTPSCPSATDKPWVYTTGLHYPYVAPVVYAAPPVVQVPVTNTCRNEAGALVPCAQPAGVVGDAVHAYADAAIPGFVQHGAL